jgi:outer membrane biosynthesis protein TonB
MNNLALNLASQNKLDQAIDMLKKAKEISPGRVEIERNLRIVSTLQEGADDFIIKQEQAKNEAAKSAPVPKTKAAAEPAPAPKKEVIATETKKKAPAEKAKPAEKEVTREDIDNKQRSPAKKTSPTPEKVEPAASSKTNARGSNQNFN